MKQQDKQALINYRIQKSKETIVDAKLALDNNRLGNTLNRIYYSIFYIVTALAQKNDFSTSKHMQLMGWFKVNYIKNGKINISLWDTYKEAFDNRQESDYKDFVVLNKSEIEQQFDDMLVFVSEIEKFINE